MYRAAERREILVTVDGPAGSGKSTTASLLAERLGFTYLDTGAMYRAATLAVLTRGIDPEDEAAVCEAVRTVSIELKGSPREPKVFLDGEDVSKGIRTLEVSEAVSPVSRHLGVRVEMVRLQRSIGLRGGIVAEGRDTGSTVFPGAEMKVFLTADIEARTRRRVAQMEAMGMKPDIGEIRRNIEERDRIDSGREHSPLRRPPGSFVVDTSDKTIDEQVTLIETKVREERERLESLRSYTGTVPRTRIYYGISKALVHLLFRLVFGLRVKGRENLAFDEPFIFASNHISFADPPLIGSVLDREVSFMAKSELFRNRLFSWLIRKYNAFPVRRGAADRRSLKEITERLERGMSVLLFPEGTRSRTGELGDLKPGLGMIALTTGRTIVPVRVRGAARLGRCLLRKERLEVRIGSPIRILPGYEPEDRRRDYEVLTGMVAESLRILDEEPRT